MDHIDDDDWGFDLAPEEPEISGNGDPKSDAAIATDIHDHTMHRLRHSHRMAIFLVIGLSLVCLCFFCVAIAAGGLYLYFYWVHCDQIFNMADHIKIDKFSLTPLLAVLAPATFSTLAGIILLITLVRFISGYSSQKGCSKDGREESSENIIYKFFEFIVGKLKDK